MNNLKETVKLQAIEIELLKLKINELETNNTGLMFKNTQLEDKISKMNLDHQDFNRNLNLKEKTISQLKIIIDDLETNNSNLGKTLSKCSKEIETKNQIIKQLETPLVDQPPKPMNKAKSAIVRGLESSQLKTTAINSSVQVQKAQRRKQAKNFKTEISTPLETSRGVRRSTRLASKHLLQELLIL